MYSGNRESSNLVTWQKGFSALSHKESLGQNPPDNSSNPFIFSFEGACLPWVGSIVDPILGLGALHS
jgi:hypothetical protein